MTLKVGEVRIMANHPWKRGMLVGKLNIACLRMEDNAP